MKETTLHSLITARSLYDHARALIDSGERHACSAGLILLQDSLEIVFLALLIEKDADDTRALEKETFDQLMSRLKESGLRVPKKGTLSALNKQRVIVKHHGQVADPIAARTYAEATEAALDGLLTQVIGKGFRDIFLAELITPGEARDFLVEASRSLENGEPFYALISVRKAIYIEIESAFAIHKWRDEPPDPRSLFGLIGGGLKAPAWKRSSIWIAENVREPTQYVQLDHERLSLDAMEWGVNTVELENVLRLSPAVFREEKDGPWHIRQGADPRSLEELAADTRYCLDRAIAILRRKQEHQKKTRFAKNRFGEWQGVSLAAGEPVYAKATTESKVVHTVQAEYQYSVNEIVTGFSADETYYRIHGFKPAPDTVGTDWVFGYVKKSPSPRDEAS